MKVRKPISTLSKGVFARGAYINLFLCWAMKPLIIEGPISNIGGLFLLEMPTFDEDRNEHYNEMQRADNMGS